MSDDQAEVSLVEVTARIVAAHVSNNSVGPSELPGLIAEVHQALAGLADQATSGPMPAVPIEESITPHFIVCLEDGKRLKTLKRHLRSAFGLTPDEYRAKWNLPPDYPMVAARYSRQRRALAKKIGLGRKAGKKTASRHPSAP